MRDFRSVITSAFLALAAWTATVNPSQADSGTVRVIFSTAGVVAGTPAPRSQAARRRAVTNRSSESIVSMSRLRCA